VRWPNGATEQRPVPPDAKTVVVRQRDEAPVGK
jgi:hypothetical protein